jgi:hypothetical protein
VAAFAVDNQKFFQTLDFCVVKKNAQGVPCLVSGKAVEINYPVGTFAEQPPPPGCGGFCPGGQIGVLIVNRSGLFVPLVKNFSKIHLDKTYKAKLWLHYYGSPCR